MNLSDNAILVADDLSDSERTLLALTATPPWSAPGVSTVSGRGSRHPDGSDHIPGPHPYPTDRSPSSTDPG